jgi:exosome complex RNA-binding protein Rrp42 (RNase PH superfamily)
LFSVYAYSLQANLPLVVTDEDEVMVEEETMLKDSELKALMAVMMVVISLVDGHVISPSTEGQEPSTMKA